jgi:hypothetical protein
MQTRGQFHQHFIHSFYVRKLCARLFCAYILGLYFTSARLLAQKLRVERSPVVNFTIIFKRSFSANYLVPKKYKAKLEAEKNCEFNFYMKKLLIKKLCKLTYDWNGNFNMKPMSNTCWGFIIIILKGFPTQFFHTRIKIR